jgi:CelD/BcsL family acetyltransferase involved in cellulose biosynthesis
MASCLADGAEGRIVFESFENIGEPDQASGRAWTSVTQATIGSTLWTLEMVPIERRADWICDLEALSDTAGGVNVFFEPAFQEAAIGRIGSPRRMMMLVKEHVGEEASLRMALPVTEEHHGLPPVRMLRAFSHPYAPLSAPLIDLREAEETTLRFAELFSQLSPRLALALEDLPCDDAGSRRLIGALSARGMTTDLICQRDRAVFTVKAGALSAGRPLIGSKETARKNARSMKRLRELGDVRLETTVSYVETMLRFEEFLVLEARGWKGRKGGAIIANRKLAPFARQSISELAKRDKASVISLRLDGRAIASLIMLRSAGRYYPWKIAVDDTYRHFSPGIILAIEAIVAVGMRPGFEFVDTLTAEGSWIERIVRERMPVATLVIAADERIAKRASLALSRLADARKLIKRFIGRGPSVPSKLPHAPAREKPVE